MNQTRIIFLLIAIAFICNRTYAVGPTNVKQFINHSDWNFVENKGQLADENGNIQTNIKYYGRQGGVNIYCKPGIISFAFTKVEKENKDEISEALGRSESPFGGGRGRTCAEGEGKTSINRADLVLLNANPSAQILATDQQEYYENFYTTGNADHGITNVHTYKTITYKSIYPNIDLVLHAKPNGMKYEFVVYPGGKVSDIQMKWKGLEKIEKLKDSKIEYSLALGKMDESKPVSFQGDNIIASVFEKHSNVVGFKVNRYDKSKTLVIDPTLIWGTYFGGSNQEIGRGICVDDSENVYVVGYTGSSSGIATMGTFRSSPGDINPVNAFIAKFTASGSRIWSTYFGNDAVLGESICIDAVGSIFISGTTISIGIATTGAYQTFWGGRSDAYLAKFNGSGGLQWATYYGGSGDEWSGQISLDISGNVYMTGGTNSTNRIATSGSYQVSLAGTEDAYIAKFSNSGKILWATYYGESDQSNGIITDNSGSIYITGTTSSNAGIATSGAFKTSISGTSDAFLAKFKSSGSLAWATYYGGNGTDEAQGVSADAFGNLYIAGFTTSNSGMATSSAYQTTYSGGTAAFLAKFNSAGAESWATYYGNNSTQALGVNVDLSGNIYITGNTTSSSGITTSGAYQTVYGGGTDAFLAKFNSKGAETWSSYYGGGSFDIGWGVVADKKGNAYITGITQSTNSIATSGAFQTSYQGDEDAFIAKFAPNTKGDAGVDSILSLIGNSCLDTFPVIIRVKNYGIDTLKSVSIATSINGKPQTFYSWTGKLEPDSSIKLNIGTDTFPQGTNTLKVWTSDPNGGIDSIPTNDTASAIIHIHSLPTPDAGPDTTLCYNETYTMQGSGGITYTWHPATYLSSATDPNAIAILPNTEHYELIVQNSYGCIDSAPVLLKVRPKLKLKAIAVNNPVCYGKDVILYAMGSGGDSLHYKYQWVNDGASGDSITEKGIQSGWHKVILKDNCTPDSVIDSVFVQIILPAKADFTFGQAQKIKINQKTDFLNQSTNASSYLWTFDTKDSSKLVSPVYIYTDSGEYEIELIAYGIDGCPNDTAYKVIRIIGNLVTIYIPDAFSPNGDGINDFFDISGVGIQSYSYNIYNRWGEHIFRSDLGHTAWDGVFKGQPVMEGVYIYQLDVIDIEGQHHYLSGNITLMR